MRILAAITLLVTLTMGQWVSHPAHAADLDAAWRKMFRRESGIPPSADNPLTPEKIALGAALFSDTRLSGSGKRACATCHQPARSYTDGRARSLSLTGAPLRRNTPPLWDLAWGKHYFWDGRASSLEEQVALPIENVDEMGGHWPQILRTLGDDPKIVSAFRAAFPDETSPSRPSVVKALASFVRSLVSPRTRFDDWVDGSDAALRPGELRGFRLFTGKAGCALCHVGWRFTDDRFHDIGLRDSDPGRGALPEGTAGLKAFKTPSLREIAHTAPYMHDGSLPTLSSVAAHYAGNLVRRPSLSTHLDPKLRLTPQETSDLVAFLATLSSERKPTLPARENGLRWHHRN